MKIGHERPPLSARLSALQTQEDQTTASEIASEEVGVLMDSMLASFKAAFTHSSNSALSTIEADMASLVLANRKTVSASIATMQADLNLIRRATQFGPWVIATCLILLIAVSFALSWCWAQTLTRTAQRTALTDIGITPSPSPSGMLLLVDGSKLSLTPCTLQGSPVTCLKTVQAAP